MNRRLAIIMLALTMMILSFSPASAADPDWDGDVSLIFYGDSRTQGMAMCAGGCSYVGKTGAGYSWMSGSGYSYLKDMMSQCPDAGIVFCFGVNDMDNVESYISFFKQFLEDYPEKNAYFASVNPVADQYAAANGYGVRNASVEAFNERVEEELPDYYIDTYKFLAAGGYDTLDGVHYGSETYVEIQNLTKILIEAKKMEGEY